MTEQEIIDFLKKNKETGIAFAFMPDDVQEWCYTNNGKVIFYHISKINHDGEWADHSDNDVIFEPTDIVALPDSFQIKQEPQSGWFEYEIDKNGNFYSADADDKDGRYYHWSEWNTCLANNKDNLIVFGGWQYEEDGDWHTSPQLSLIDDTKREYHIGRYTDGKAAERVKPLIPIKIRFWRESQ